MSEAFFFGPDDRRQIFAIYHPPESGSGDILSVICPPLFAELNRTHSLLRKLAIALAERGQHVLRMDYNGTGDSYGNLEEVTVSDWIKNIETTIEEGRELTGCRAVRLLSVRASALLACKTAAAMSDIDRIVMWDPFYDGPAYLKALMQEQAAALETHHYLESEVRRSLGDHYEIYRMSPSMREEFELISGDTISRIPTSKIRIMNTTTNNKIPLVDVVSDHVPFSCHWQMQTEGVLLSQPIIEKLQCFLT